jgi:hypothetical protein
MTGNFILKTDEVEISPTVAKFGVTTYQVANIESLTVGQRRRMNPLALIPLFFGFGLLASGFAVGGYLSGSFRDNLRDGPATYLFGMSILLVTLGMIIQLAKPRMSSALTLKTASGDVDALVCDDSEHVAAVQRALEEAFSRRG